jgi:hypothetical protein
LIRVATSLSRAFEGVDSHGSGPSADAHGSSPAKTK